MEEPTQDVAAYEAPAVVDYGDLVALTAMHSDGNYTDQDFPAHTPKGALTFS
jgi:hypothetical protein